MDIDGWKKRFMGVVKNPTRKDLILVVGVLLVVQIFISLLIFLYFYYPEMLALLIVVVSNAIIGILFLLVVVALIRYYLKRRKERLKFEAEQRAKGLVKYKNRWGTPDEVKKWREVDRYATLPTITEIKCTCNQCGKVWHYLPSDTKPTGVETGGALMAIGGCMTCNPLLTLGGSLVQNVGADKTRKKLATNCPKCNSTNITKERITYKKR